MSAIYIAGPMSGIPAFNVPMFHRAAAAIRKANPNDVVINPASMDTPTMQKYALESRDGDLKDLESLTRETWGEVLGRDVTLVADHIDEIALMPGWEHSRGARLEAFVGLLTRKRFWKIAEDTFDLVPIGDSVVRHGVLA
jgi:hypothetical protein